MFVRKIGAVLGGTLVASSFALSAVAPAQAEPADPTAIALGDLEGTGSDTTQYLMQSLANAFNGTTPAHRLYSWDACSTPVMGDPTSTPCTPDTAGAGGFDIPATANHATAITSRPGGSGPGRALLYAADNSGKGVAFARSSGAQSQADTDKGLKSFPYAIDTLVAVTAKNTHAPANLSGEQILKIYTGQITDWSQVGGQPGKIVALLPKSGSGTRDFFAKTDTSSQLAKLNGGTAVTAFGAQVADKWDNDNNPATPTVDVQEHDPAPITSNPDAIAPFSLGRVGLSDPAGTKLHVLGGWKADRAVYNVLRGQQVAGLDTVDPNWLAGSATADAIFGTNGFICSADAQRVIALQGFYQMKRLADGGLCGQALTAGASNLAAYGKPADSTVSVSATSGAAGVAHPVTVTVNNNATGTVAVNIGSWVGTGTLSGGTATVQAPASLAAGTYTVYATYGGTPTVAGNWAKTTLTVTGASAPVDTRPKGKFKETFPSAVKKGKKATGTIKVVSPKRFTGTVRIMEGTKVLKVVKVKKGVSAKITLKKLKKGKHTLSVVWAGNAAYAPTTFNFKITQK